MGGSGGKGWIGGSGGTGKFGIGGSVAYSSGVIRNAYGENAPPEDNATELRTPIPALTT
jgi:hypothetical protein